jgi:hypothetical protein
MAVPAKRNQIVLLLVARSFISPVMGMERAACVADLATITSAALDLV